MNKLSEFLNEETDDLVRDFLIEEVEFLDYQDVQSAFHRVIAWFSVPGTYKEGQYDSKI